MFVKLFLFAVILLGNMYEFMTDRLSNLHDKQPLPAEVQEIYDSERYQEYLNQKRELKKLSHIHKFVALALNAFFLFSPFYQFIEHIGSSNPYVILIVTILVNGIISAAIQLPISYYSTFAIKEKYGLNKSTKKTFFKDELIDIAFTIVTLSLVFCVFAFICQSVGTCVSNIKIGYATAILIATAISAVVVVLIIAISGITFLSMHLTYKFTDMPKGELRDKIIALTDGSKQKVNRITVYNESSKSTSKNAFLLCFFGYREFCIADNFLGENSERELLAVLSHETGHLKYKKRFVDYLNYVIVGLAFMFLILAIHNVSVFSNISAIVRETFGLQYTNYYLLFTAVSLVIQPVMFIYSVLRNYQIRTQEYFADANAVAMGYGQELIDTFTKMSSDELVNVNPHPVIEFLEYEHPGMYNRIHAINKKMETRH